MHHRPCSVLQLYGLADVMGCVRVLLQMVLNTSPDVGDLREVMNYIYEDIYVEYVVRNPLYVPGQPFK
jgi:hypothetical protein